MKRIILDENQIVTGIVWAEGDLPDNSVDDIEGVEILIGDNYQEIAVRHERDRLLAESDWTQLPDSPLSESEKATWETYRQSLRDMTDASGFPFIDFPVAP